MAFTGRATYSAFNTIAEDVSDMVSIITPHETPLLDYLGDADRPVMQTKHEWLEDELAPNTIVASSAVASASTDTVMGVAAGKAAYLQVGTVLRQPVTNEYFTISVIAGNSITLTRGFGGTVANSFAAGQNLEVISDAALEGDDVTQDSSTNRSRNSNFVQLIKKDIIVSGTQQAVALLGGIEDEFEYQKMKKLTEAVRDLEKVAIMGIASGNTIGSGTARRTMAGIRSLITTNVRSVGPVLTESWLGTAIQDAWQQGGTDVDLILSGVAHKRIIDGLNATRIQVTNDDPRFRNRVSYYESTFGVMTVMLCRWLPASEALILSSRRIKVPPLATRSFMVKNVLSQGDSKKAMVLGEYTVELRNEAGMSRLT
jgi:hypothetical protein